MNASTKTTPLEQNELVGLEALSQALAELLPVGDSQELWLKYGNERFVVTETFDPNGPCWETKLKERGNPKSRIRTTKQPSLFEFLTNKSHSEDGGIFIIPSQPQGFPGKDAIEVSNNICAELDDGTPEQQWDKSSEFTQVSGLHFKKIISSGGKSYHLHIHGKEHFPIAQTVYLRRLLCIALMSDPAACNPSQPMRIEGFDRYHNGQLKGHQTRLYQSDERYSYQELIDGFKAYFAWAGLPFPDTITDQWWTALKRPIKAQDFELLLAKLETGLAGFEASKVKPKPTKPISLPVTNGLGQSISDCIAQSVQKLGTSLFEQHGYVEGDRRFCCPFHQSQSQNSAWISPADDGTPLFHCPTCTGEKGINSFVFSLWMKHGVGTPMPNGKAYFEAGKEFCHLAGDEIPESIKPKQTATQSSPDLLPQNKWKKLAEHNCQMGRWTDKECPFLPDDTEEENNQFLLDNPNFIKLKEKITIKQPDADCKMVDVTGHKTLRFIPETNFVFTIERILQSESNGGGYVFRIERNINGKLSTNRVTVNGKDCLKISDFMNAINTSLGLHLICNSSLQSLAETLQVKTDEYYSRNKQIGRLAPRVGCQDDGYWVFENIQFKPDGTVTDETESNWIFDHRLSSGDEHIPSPKIADPDPNALTNLVKAMRAFLGDNFIRGLAVLGYAAASAHYQTIIKVEGASPICNLYGEPGSLKTVSAECAGSLFGINWPKDGTFSSSSVSALYERLKCTGNLPTIYDDPQRDGGSLDETIKPLHNGKPRVVRGNVQTPYSPILVTTNHVCGDDSPATRSRLIRLFFPVVKLTEENKSAWPALMEAQKKASGALPDIIAIGYPKAQIDAIERELISHLSGAHIRIAKSLAILTFYTQKVCDLAGLNLDFKQWAIANLCPNENDEDANKNSLEDFLEKVAILQGKSLLGEWNTRLIEKDGEEYHSLVLSEVWSAVDKEFKPPYSLSLIKALVTQNGGLHNQQRKFYPDRDITLTYERNRLEGGEDARKPTLKNKKCSLIPARVTKVTKGNHQGNQNGYPNFSSPVSVSGFETAKVTKVTKNLVTFEEEEEEGEPKQAEISFTPPREDAIKNPVTLVTLVTLDEKNAQNACPATVVEGNQNGYLDGYPMVTLEPHPTNLLGLRVGDRRGYKKVNGEVVEVEVISASRHELKVKAESWPISMPVTEDCLDLLVEHKQTTA